jgi:FKBP-type peptidyl-prolyl cis-trans isomerase FklB
MDYDGRASVAEERMAVAAKRDVFVLQLEMRLAVRAHREVGIVAGVMALRIFQPMFLPVGIEVASRRLEVGGIALRVLMKVDGVFAGWEILEIEFHSDSGRRFPQNGGAHNLALSILELNQNLRRTGRRDSDDEQCEREQASGFHGGIIAKIRSRRSRGCGKVNVDKQPLKGRPIRVYGIAKAMPRYEACVFPRRVQCLRDINPGLIEPALAYPALAQKARQCDNRYMQRSLTTALLLAAATMLAGDGYAQQTPPASTPAATTPAAPAATTPKAATTAKAPVKKTGTAAAPAPLATQKDKFSYALGMNIGTGYSQGLKKQSVEVDWNLVIQGLKDAATSGKTRLTEDEAKAVLNEVQTEVHTKQLQAAAAEGEAFLAANKSKEGVVTLPSGLQYKILTTGTGPKPAASDSVECNYRGTFVNGTEFDNSSKRGKPVTFPVSGVIKGWTEALQLMPVGSKWQLVIPSSLAYGEGGNPRGGIGPNETLIFEVELLSIKDKAKDEKATDDKTKDDKSGKPEEKKE